MREKERTTPNPRTTETTLLGISEILLTSSTSADVSGDSAELARILREHNVEYAQKVSPTLLCPVCTEPAKQPVSHRLCTRLFCRECLSQWIHRRTIVEKQPAECPHCREPLLSGSCEWARHMEQVLDEYPLYCPHCRAAVLRGELMSHINSACPVTSIKRELEAVKEQLIKERAESVRALEAAEQHTKQVKTDIERRSAEKLAELQETLNKEAAELSRQKKEFRDALNASSIPIPTPYAGGSVVSSSAAAVVHLNVSGTKISVSRQLLLAYPHSLLARQITGDLPAIYDEHKRLLVNADPKLFRYIIAWLSTLRHAEQKVGASQEEGKRVQECFTGVVPVVSNDNEQLLLLDAMHLKMYHLVLKLLPFKTKWTERAKACTYFSYEDQDAIDEMVNAYVDRVRTVKNYTHEMFTIPMTARPFNDLSEVNWSKKILKGEDLSQCTLQRANLQKADLRGAKMNRSNLREADLQDAKLQFADLTEADLQSAKLQRANLQQTALQRANLKKANLQGADLQGTDLRGADLQGCQMRGANLRGAILDEANLSDVVMHESDLEGASLIGTVLTNADLKLANLKRVNFERCNLTEANIDFSGSDMSRCVLRAVNLQRASLREVKLQEADLSEANLQQANLHEADLSEANLQGASLQEANLQQANLSSANLSNANLTRVNLSGAVVRNSQLSGSILNEATIRDVDFRGSTMSGAQVHNVDTGIRGLRFQRTNDTVVTQQYNGWTTYVIGTSSALMPLLVLSRKQKQSPIAELFRYRFDFYIENTAASGRDMFIGLIPESTAELGSNSLSGVYLSDPKLRGFGFHSNGRFFYYSKQQQATTAVSYGGIGTNADAYSIGLKIRPGTTIISMVVNVCTGYLEYLVDDVSIGVAPIFAKEDTDTEYRSNDNGRESMQRYMDINGGSSSDDEGWVPCISLYNSETRVRLMSDTLQCITTVL